MIAGLYQTLNVAITILAPNVGLSSSTLFRYRLSVIPKNMTPRTWTGTLPYTGWEIQEGLKLRYRVFIQMVGAGIPGTEETFCLLIISLAREGHVAGISSILSPVWGLDMVALLSIAEADLPPVKSRLSTPPKISCSRWPTHMGSIIPYLSPCAWSTTYLANTTSKSLFTFEMSY
jgi:hypothetical protein